MGVYLGKINIVNNVFYNYTPLYEIVDHQLIELLQSDYEKILPDSQKKNINFSYNLHLDNDFMENHFYEDTPVIFEFEESELEPNISSNGELNQTGYRIKTREAYNQGKIHKLSEYNIYRLLEENEISGDIRTSNRIELPSLGMAEGLGIMISFGEERMYAGPYEVRFRDTDMTYIGLTELKNNKYIISGYTASACKIFRLTVDGEEYVYVKPNKDAEKKYIDLITDSLLLEAFKESVSSKITGDGILNLTDISQTVEEFENSLFLLNMPDAGIRRKRLQRITELLSVADDVDDTIKFISETMCAALGDLIKKYEGTEEANNLINTIITHNPNLLRNIQDYKIVQQEVDALEKRKAQLENEIDSLKGQSEQKQLTFDNEEVRKSLSITSKEVIESIEKKEALEKDIEKIEAKLGKLYNLSNVSEELEKLETKIKYFDMRKIELERETAELSSSLLAITSNIEGKMADIYIDGLVANHLQEASALWQKTSQEEKYNAMAKYYETVGGESLSSKELVEYLYAVINKVRPQYDKNTIINIMTSVFNNFITVFSGEPGSGKTSICNILGQALGINGEFFKDSDYSRYIQVSVERGWTSKKDLIGYYNPLTKRFDVSDKKFFDALRVLDIECRKSVAQLPLLVLLDEANLSPMEYYWADFMNVCDDLDLSNEINIGGEMALKIPETLHFVATINNDHTTEALSPRLIDRAGVITLPRIAEATYNNAVINEENLKCISWNSIKQTFCTENDENPGIGVEASKIYASIKEYLKKQNIFLSPRVEISIRKYCDIPSRLYEKNADTMRRDPSIIAIDYAVAQKILPKVNGYGDDFRQWLDGLKEKCNEYSLTISQDIISEMINKGDGNMNYYQFFA